jgi:hypothetical protein
LVLHERDQRRKNEHCSGEQLGWNLESNRFARARGHDTDAIAAAQHGIDEMPLAGPELPVAEDAFQDPLRVLVAP